jgi:uncharacterized protein (TIGR01244 family)
MIRQLDDRILVSGQIRPEEIVGLAARHNVTMLINNRPDSEEPDQPRASAIEAAAEAAGISYRHVPILRGIGPADVAAMQAALREAGDGQVLAFCRTGNRSALTWALAARGEGQPREAIEHKVEVAGFNVAPIAHLL